MFATHFRTKGNLNYDEIMFVWRSFRKRWYAKIMFLKDGVRRVDRYYIHFRSALCFWNSVFGTQDTLAVVLSFFFFYKRRNVNFLPSHLCAGNHDHALVESHPLGIALRKNCPLWSTVYTSESQQTLYLVNTSTTKTLTHNCEHNYTNNSRYTEVISQALSHLN